MSTLVFGSALLTLALADRPNSLAPTPEPPSLVEELNLPGGLGIYESLLFTSSIVKSELDLSAEQLMRFEDVYAELKSKIITLHRKLSRGAAHSGDVKSQKTPADSSSEHNALPPVDAEQFRMVNQSLHLEASTAIFKILTESQRGRIGQIKIYYLNSALFRNPVFLEHLQIHGEQRHEIEKLIIRMVKDARPSIVAAKRSNENMPVFYSKINLRIYVAIKGSLTSHQQKILSDIEGRPFRFEPHDIQMTFNIDAAEFSASTE